jgi:hypothetical protein
MDLRNMKRFSGAEAWAKLTPEQQAEIGAIALELIVSREGNYLHFETRTTLSGLFDHCEAVIEGLIEDTIRDALHSRVPEVLNDHHIPIPSLVGQVCRICGCTSTDPTLEICSECRRRTEFHTTRPSSWAETDLCTNCKAQSAAGPAAKRAKSPADAGRAEQGEAQQK